ncbi:hypothetical protein TraAM80_05151 [Trypanosoma rangeli]|uniref:Uncharacterized protein n=1 Tax=Trypanosoma rangeli TaxID=5698 RepID=A0A3R7KAP3_TRYRA|nr:uncharacterized protein TraAM80_05151 [Trypanosoma rangeli]RNF04436.1 hypothetical protein TraAM80_05151 [Trypanosoma rangeli]|eukprot:RNF04436.1 hypothetical protein TraAM80_05151 [Trypanosoma rangeli]
MPHRSPPVQVAMATVSRRMRVRRAPPRRSTVAATTTSSTPHISLLVTPVLKDLYTEMASLPSSLSSAPQGLSKGSADLMCKLRLHLQMEQESVSPTAVAHDVNLIKPKKYENTTALDSRVEDALPLYNPTLDPTILRRVAVAIDIDGALKRARDFVRAIRDGGNFRSILSSLRRLQPELTMQELELQVGIAARLHHGKDGQRASRLRGFRMYTSDIQVAEVLPNGKIVTFISPTLPDTFNISQYKSAGPEQRYLHFVLYKEGLSLSEAFRLLSETCEGMCLPEHFAANVALEESAVTVQVCSLCLIPSDSNFDAMHQVTVIKKLLRVNLRPLKLNLQLLGWRTFPCDPLHSHRCQMQYSMLLRGITTTQPTQLEKKVQGHLAAFTNFFGPRHFGMLVPLSPFRSFHATAAWEKNMPAEALLIAACLSDDTRTTVEESWIDEMVELFQKGEDRPAVLKEWYHLHVSRGLRTQIERSKSDLLWNVLASCRIHELKRGAVTGSPEPGEFVLPDSNCFFSDEMVAKPELFPDGCLPTKTCDYRDLRGVCVVDTREEAASHSIRDIVIPLNMGSNESMSQLSRLLGFVSISPKGTHYPQNPVSFRPLFFAGSGHPRATRPWVKVLPELSNVLEGNGEGVYKLLTDMELRQCTSYTATSRGQPGCLWPIGKYGFRLAERLPAGAVALTASDTARQRGTKALALHFTLPAHAYSMALFREFMAIEDHAPLPNAFVDSHCPSETRRSADATDKNIVALAVSPHDAELVDGDLLGKMRIK